MSRHNRNIVDWNIKHKHKQYCVILPIVCIYFFSGVFGVLLSLCAIQIIETYGGDKADVSKIQGLAKVGKT